MEEPAVSFKQLANTSKHFARRLLTIGENRLELLTLEVQEERERLLHDFLLALGVAVLGLLAGITLTAAIVACLWSLSPVGVLLTMSAIYGLSAFAICRRLTGRLRSWQTLSGTLDQLRKDRACLEKTLE